MSENNFWQHFSIHNLVDCDFTDYIQSNVDLSWFLILIKLKVLSHNCQQREDERLKRKNGREL